MDEATSVRPLQELSALLGGRETQDAAHRHTKETTRGHNSKRVLAKTQPHGTVVSGFRPPGLWGTHLPFLPRPWYPITATQPRWGRQETNIPAPPCALQRGAWGYALRQVCHPQTRPGSQREARFVCDKCLSTPHVMLKGQLTDTRSHKWYKRLTSGVKNAFQLPLSEKTPESNPPRSANRSLPRGRGGPRGKGTPTFHSTVCLARSRCGAVLMTLSRTHWKRDTTTCDC